MNLGFVVSWCFITRVFLDDFSLAFSDSISYFM